MQPPAETTAGKRLPHHGKQKPPVAIPELWHGPGGDSEDRFKTERSTTPGEQRRNRNGQRWACRGSSHITEIRQHPLTIHLNRWDRFAGTETAGHTSGTFGSGERSRRTGLLKISLRNRRCHQTSLETAALLRGDNTITLQLL